ncbi:MAG TPA: carboxypeptidase-like regulatory domain-containing protein, partial [Chitinophagaceae bacterium]
MKESIILVLLFLFFHGPATFAQRRVISGVVRDEQTQEKIPFAAVYFSGTSTGTTTDAEGNYSFILTHFPADSLSVTVIGYQSV